ncbi:MAG: hypothetical protein ACXVW5_20655 [Solirubrobacteraceae bacterium]
MQMLVLFTALRPRPRIWIPRRERIASPPGSLGQRAGTRRICDVVIVLWRAERLDRQLAAGVRPRASSVLALRAQRITGRRSRVRVANGLARAVRDVQAMTPGFSAAVRPHPGDVLSARTVLRTLEIRLRGPEPVSARGMALLSQLLTDGSSALYRPDERGALGSQLRAAAAALEPETQDVRTSTERQLQASA